MTQSIGIASFLLLDLTNRILSLPQAYLSSNYSSKLRLQKVKTY